MIALAELKAALRLDAADTSEDAYLAALEAAAVRYVERVTGRYFGPAVSRTEYLEGAGQRELYLQDEPQVGSVVVTSDGAAVAGTSYEVRGRKIRHTSAWGQGYYPSDVKVVYQAGYTAGSEPPDIRLAVTRLVTLWYEVRMPPLAADALSNDEPHGIDALIAPYRRWRA